MPKKLRILNSRQYNELVLKLGENKKGQKISNCTIFLILFYSWQLGEGIQQKMVQLENFGPSNFVMGLKISVIHKKFKYVRFFKNMGLAKPNATL